MKFYRTIALDFDGTVCKHAFPEIGIIEKINKRVIDFIRYQKSFGSIIVLWTCRVDSEQRKYLQEAVDFCKNNNIPIDYVNENTTEVKKAFGQDPRKIIADLYLDDKAMNILDLGVY